MLPSSLASYQQIPSAKAAVEQKATHERQRTRIDPIILDMPDLRFIIDDRLNYIMLKEMAPKERRSSLSVLS